MNKLADHLFVSSTDGHLYDTRKPEWHKHAPLRKDYCRTFETINNSRELRATIRNGAYAWPGEQIESAYGETEETENAE